MHFSANIVALEEPNVTFFIKKTSSDKSLEIILGKSEIVRSDQYLSCVLHFCAGDVMSVQLLEMRNVVKHVCSIVVQQTYWVRGSCGII